MIKNYRVILLYGGSVILLYVLRVLFLSQTTIDCKTTNVYVLACQFADFNIISSMPEQYLMNDPLSMEPKSTSLLSESETTVCVMAALRP